MPRPTKLTPKLQEQVVGYLRAGAYVETAAAAAGIARDTLYVWLRRGARGDAPYADFAQAVEHAQALAELRDVAIIGKAAETQWQAAAWRLERKLPQRWGLDRLTKTAARKLTQARTQALVDFDAILAGATADELARIQEIVTSVRKRATGNAGGGTGAPPGE